MIRIIYSSSYCDWGVHDPTWYCSSAPCLSCSSFSSCIMASLRALSFASRSFCSSCFSASVSEIACCCLRWISSSSARLVDSSSSNLRQPMPPLAANGNHYTSKVNTYFYMCVCRLFLTKNTVSPNQKFSTNNRDTCINYKYIKISKSFYFPLLINGHKSGSEGCQQKNILELKK